MLINGLNKMVKKRQRAILDVMPLLLLFSMQFCIHGVNGAEHFIVSRTSRAWSDAKSSCGSARGSLGLADTPERMRMFQRDVLVRPGVPVWVDRYVGHTGIVTEEGCYGNRTLTYKNVSVIPDNTLVRCLTQCKKYPYLAMQGPLCFCLSELPQRISPVSGLQCNTVCPGDTGRVINPPVSQCGNPDMRINTVAVYRKVRPGEISIDKNLPNEGECISYNIRTRLWQHDNCTNPRPFVCTRKPCFQPLVNCMVESPMSSDWQQSRMRCHGTNFNLATVNFTTDDYFFNKPSMQFPFYWTGLHRQEVTIWGNDRSAGEVILSDKCVAMVKGPDGRWIWFLDWCVKEHQYVCLENYTDTIVTTPRNPLRPTAVRPTTTTRRPVQTTTTRTTRSPVTVSPVTTSTSWPGQTEPIIVNVTSSASTVAWYSGYPVLSLIATVLAATSTMLL